MTQPAGPFDSARSGVVAGALKGRAGNRGGSVIMPSMLCRGAIPQPAVRTSLAVVLPSAAVAVWRPPDALRAAFGVFSCCVGTRTACRVLRR